MNFYFDNFIKVLINSKRNMALVITAKLYF